MQPHDSPDLDGLDIALRWIAIPPMVWEDIGLPHHLKSYTAFVGHFGLDDDEEVGGHSELPDFVPNGEGIGHELPDGVTIQVRMQRSPDGA